MRDLGDADSRYNDHRNLRNLKNQKLSKIAFIFNDLRKRVGAHVIVQIKGGELHKIHGRLEMRLQLPNERHAMIGRLWETGFKHVIKLEQELRQQGGASSIDDMRRKAGTCLNIFMQGMRGTFKVVAFYEDEIQAAGEELELTLFPTPIGILILALAELQNDRPSRLLSHLQLHGFSEGPYNLIRRITQAKAVASVQILRETGLTHTKASNLVADALNNSPFSKPGDEKKSKRYSAETINDWRKRARNKKGDFADIVLQQRQELESLVDILRQRQSTDDEIRTDILARLQAFIEATSYGYE